MAAGDKFRKKKENRWIFSKDELQQLASNKPGGAGEQDDLRNRQIAAGFIQEMGEKLNHSIKDPRGRLSQLCMCAAMIHMHRFYVFHSFKMFDGKDIAAASLFLAGKSEECPRKLEHIVRVWHMLKFPNFQQLDVKSDRYMDSANYIVTLENILLQTIAFDLTVEVPHPHVLKAVQRIFKGSQKNLAETAYYFASDILHLTNYCVRHRASSIACVCINLACVWASCEIPHSQDNKPWYFYVDPNMTEATLDTLTQEFGRIYTQEKDRLNIRRHGILKRQPQQPPSTSGIVAPHGVTNVSVNARPPPATSSGTQHSTEDSHPPVMPLHDPATKAPPSSSLLKRVKTEPAVLDLNKYRERKIIDQQQQQPSQQRKSFMPDTSSFALKKEVMKTTKPVEDASSRKQKEKHSHSSRPKQLMPPPPVPPEINSHRHEHSSRSQDRKRPSDHDHNKQSISEPSSKHRRTDDRREKDKDKERQRRHSDDQRRRNEQMKNNIPSSKHSIPGDPHRRSHNQPIPRPRNDSDISRSIMNELEVSEKKPPKPLPVSPAMIEKVFNPQDEKLQSTSNQLGPAAAKQAAFLTNMRSKFLGSTNSDVKSEPNGVGNNNSKKASSTPDEDLEEGEIPDMPPIPNERPPEVPPPPNC